MRGLSLERVERVSELPGTWDTLAQHPFQRRDFLRHAETYNPCRQRYYLLHDQGHLRAGACVYTLRRDLFTFWGIPSPVRLHFLGVPCSVSASGLIGMPAHQTELVTRLIGAERGLVVGLNLDNRLSVDGATFGRTLPTVVLDVDFPTWDDYRRRLRSTYRRRMERSLAAWRDVASERGSCRRMTPELYTQYLDVYQRSSAKLERLSIDFFTNLPDAFELTIHRRGSTVLAWHITAVHQNLHTFLFSGIDHRAWDAGTNYMNVLYTIVRQAIEARATCVDLGQTAEVPKTRLGGRTVEKNLFGLSQNSLVRWGLRQGRCFLEYRTIVPKTHVFRDSHAQPVEALS